MSSIVEQIKTLEELAALDAALRSVEEKLTEERTTLNGLTESLKQTEEKLESERAHLATAERARADCQTEVRNMTHQIDHSRDKLNRSRTERESNAAQREIEELRKLLRDREEDVNKLNEEAVASQTQIDTTEAEAKRIRAELAACQDDIRAKVTLLEADKSDRQGGREAIVKRLPPVLYRRYDMLRQKRGVAIAQTTDGTCKACNMSLPPQLFHRLRREPTIDQCPSCNRIIYYALPASAEPAQS